MMIAQVELTRNNGFEIQKTSNKDTNSYGPYSVLELRTTNLVVLVLE